MVIVNKVIIIFHFPQADLCDGKELLNLPLSPVHSGDPRSIQVKLDPVRVCLVPKSEAAAAEVVFKQMEEFDDNIINSCYMVVDLGERAVEVSLFSHQNGRYELLQQPRHYHGGCDMVNKAFFKYLSHEILHDDNFERYFQHENKIIHNADFHVTLCKSFEHAKVEFASCVNNNSLSYFTVDVPPSFFKVYKHQLHQLDDDSPVQLERRNQTLRISYSKFDEFISECFDRTKEAIDNAFEFAAVKNKAVKAIYLAGGMGGSRYMVDKIRSCYDVDTSIMDDHMLATVHGACYYYRNILVRISRANYGIGCAVPYDDTNITHQEEGERLLSEDDQYYCSSVFVPLLRNNDQIDPLKVHTRVLTPMYCEQSVLTVTLYSTTTNRPPSFVTNTNTGIIMEGVTELASLDVNIELGMDTLSLAERQVQVTVQFGYEIVLTAEYNGRNKISTVVMM